MIEWYIKQCLCNLLFCKEQMKISVYPYLSPTKAEIKFPKTGLGSHIKYKCIGWNAESKKKKEVYGIYFLKSNFTSSYSIKKTGNKIIQNVKVGKQKAISYKYN